MINERWVSNDGEHGGFSSVARAENDDEDQEGADMNVQDAKQPAIDFGVGTSVGHQGDGDGGGPKLTTL